MKRMSDFTAGMVSTLSIYSLIQDYYGKEEYIGLIQNYWTESIITIPVAIIFLCLSFFSYIKNNS